MDDPTEGQGPGESGRPPLPTPAVTEKARVRQVLEVFSAAAGVLCLADSAREALSGGLWHSYTDIYAAYFIILGGYASTREFEKWTDPAAEEMRYGHLFVAAWCVLALGLYALDVFNYYPPIAWPTRLTDTLKWVVGLYVGGKVSGHIRRSRLAGRWPAVPAAGAAGSGAAGGDADAPGDGSESEGLDPQKLQAVADACRRAGEFSIRQIATAAGVPKSTVHRYLDALAEQGKVKFEGGKWRWTGG